MKATTLSLFLLFSATLFAQPDRWQQRIKYTIDVDMNVQTNQYKGRQSIQYWNNSPDTLHRVFFHLYWNAFQPGSMMDQRSLRQGNVQVPKRNGTGPDWDARVSNRIAALKPDEIGYEKVTSLKMNGREQKTLLHETILEVVLDNPFYPNHKQHSTWSGMRRCRCKFAAAAAITRKPTFALP